MNGFLPDDNKAAEKIAAQALSFAVVDRILYFVNSKHNRSKRYAVPCHLRTQFIEENHSGPMAGHFSGEKLCKLLVTHWWWQGMYSDVMSHCVSCQCCRQGKQASSSPNTSSMDI